MTGKSLFVTLAVLVMLSGARLVEAGDALSDFVVVSWTERDGLPSSDVRSIVQDREGYIWLGTSEGLYRFDGVRFLRWDAPGEAPLPERRVLRLLSSSDGSLWVALGGSGGVSRIRNRDVTHYGKEQGLVDDFIRSLAEDRDGAIWAGGRGGLYRFSGRRWERLTGSDGLPEGPVYELYVDRRGRLWVSARAGVFCLESRSDPFRQVDEGSEFPRGFSEDPAGGLWVTDPRIGFRNLHKRHHLAHASRADREGNGFGLIYDRRGNLWVATAGDGLWRVRFDEQQLPRIQVISAGNGLSDNSVRALLEDREGNIWAGTQAGLHRFSPRTVTAVTELGLVRAVEAGRDGSVWVGTTSSLVRIHPHLGARKELSGSLVSALHEDANGTLWIGTNQGLLRFANNRISAVVTDPSAQPRTIASISSAPDGTVWLCDREEGLFKLRNGHLVAVETPPQLRRRTPYAVHVQARGRVWVAFSGGVLARIDANEGFTLHTLPSRSNGALRAIYDDGKALWLAGDDGLTRFADGRFVTAGQDNGLPGNAVSAVTTDSDGYVWAGVPAGIIRLDSKEFDALASNLSHRLRYSITDESDGVAGSPFWRGNPSSVRTHDGQLWFVTTAGVTVVDPRVSRRIGSPPRARIEGLLVRDRRFDATPQATFPPGTRNLQIEYTTLGAASPSKVRFRYRLEGADSDWIEAGAKHQAVYTNLDPGHYRFHVVATTTDGAWHQSDDVWEFSIRPAYYQTSAFYSFCTTALLLLAWLAYRMRLRQVRREFAAVLSERVRLSREIHDTLLQNLVALALHFESLARKLAVSSPALREDVTRIRREIEDYVRETRQSVWALRSAEPVHRDLTAMLQEAGRRCTNGSGARFEFTSSGAPPRCPPRVDEQLLRIGQEAIHNAVRHARASHIRVWLERREDSLRLQVTDDGCGFDLNREPGDHCGLRGMRERSEQIGGELRIATAPGEGTQVDVVVPIPPA